MRRRKVYVRLGTGTRTWQNSLKLFLPCKVIQLTCKLCCFICWGCKTPNTTRIYTPTCWTYFCISRVQLRDLFGIANVNRFTGGFSIDYLSPFLQMFTYSDYLYKSLHTKYAFCQSPCLSAVCKLPLLRLILQLPLREN